MTMYDLRSALQDDPWQAMNEALGKKTWRLRGPGWSALCVQEKRRVGSYLYVPYGPVCASQAALTEAVRAIAALARTQRAWWVRVEPRPPVLSPHDNLTSWRETMVRASFHRAAHDHQPAHTRLIDVSRPGEDILADATGSIRTIHRALDLGVNLFDTAEAYASGHAEEVLGLPVNAPWCRISETIDFFRAVRPTAAVPIHDALLTAEGAEAWPHLPKAEVAARLARRIARALA